MHIAWIPYISNAPTVTAADVEALERRYGIRFPDAYRRDLIEHRGMTPDHDMVKFETGGGSGIGPLLLPNADPGDDAYSIASSIAALQAWAGQPDWSGLRLWPFSTNTASGLYCLDFRSNGAAEPAVVFVDLTYDLDEKGAMSPVAESYVALLGKLR